MNNEWIDNFLRIVKTTRMKVPGYLLKKVGIATHDIVLSVKSSDPIVEAPKLKLTPLVKFSPRYHLPDLYILNCSTRKTAITGIVGGISIPKTNMFTLGGLLEDEAAVDSMEWHIDFIKPVENSDTDVFDIPALEPGKVLFVAGSNFELQLICKAVIDKYDLLNTSSVYPSEDEENLRDAAITEVLENSEVWFGLILDERELLPFKWSHEEQQFVRRFDYDPVAVA